MSAISVLWMRRCAIGVKTLAPSHITHMADRNTDEMPGPGWSPVSTGKAKAISLGSARNARIPEYLSVSGKTKMVTVWDGDDASLLRRGDSHILVKRQMWTSLQILSHGFEAPEYNWFRILYGEEDNKSGDNNFSSLQQRIMNYAYHRKLPFSTSAKQLRILIFW